MMREFNYINMDMKHNHYFFIAHLFDRVLIGEKGDKVHKHLEYAIENDNVLEVHFFNKIKEIFAIRREDGQLMAYNDLLHNDDYLENIIERSYKLDKVVKDNNGKVKYNILNVKEYIDFDENDMAYIDKTILYSLEKGEEKNEQKRI